jgi:hypothetical protein
MSFISRLTNRHNHRVDDNPELSEYAQAMERGQPYIRMKIDVPGAIELGAFVGAFTALASEYERYMRSDGKSGEASLYVAEVRQGSIIADLIPVVASTFPLMAGVAGQALDLEEFIRRYGARMRRLVGPRAVDPDSFTKTELRDFTEQVAAIANAPGSTIEMAAIEIEEGDHKVKAAIKFATAEARQIRDKAEITRQQIEHRSGADRERVLMVFTRSDVRGATVGKRSGELVAIDAISDRSLPLIYASDLAEQQIKHEIAEADDNVYKKGFVVDVNVESRGGKPAAYRVTNLHQVIDLPDDD